MYPLALMVIINIPQRWRPTYGRWAPVAHGGALPLGAGATHRGAIMPHLCVKRYTVEPVYNDFKGMKKNRRYIPETVDPGNFYN